MVLILTYLPVFTGQNFAEIEQTRELIRTLAEWATNRDLLLIGGDFNGEDRQGVCGKFGLRESNRMGTELLEWCEENNFAHVASFYNHKRRGTWFNNMNR